MSEQLYEAVRSGLSVRLGERKAWHVLVDPAISDPMTECKGRDQAVPVPIRPADMPQHFRPYLLELGDFGRDDRIERTIRIAVDEAIRASPESGSRRSICGWIASNHPPATVAADLARNARVLTQGRPRMLRVWDPRTLDLLQHLLAGRLAQSLTVPGASWWWLDRDSSIKELQAVENLDATRLSIGDEQIEALLLAESLHATLNVLQDMRKDATCELTLRTIVDALRRARSQWSIADPLGQVRFALHACLVDRNFDADAEVAAAMRQADGLGESPVDALLLFDDRAWGAVIERLSTGESDRPILRQGELHHG